MSSFLFSRYSIVSLGLALSSCRPADQKGNAEVKIFNGSPQVEDVKRSTVMVYNSSEVCSGTYICASGADANKGEAWVLSAAHCGDVTSVNFGPKATSPDAECEVAARHMHPDYNSLPDAASSGDVRTKIENDIMIVKAICKKGIPKYAQCVPVLTDISAVHKNDIVTIAGYGNITVRESSGENRQLLKSTMEFNENLPKVNKLVTRSYDSNTCGGDSGGPLYVTIAGKLQVAGALARSNCDAGKTRWSYYTDATKYISWITSHTGNSVEVKNPTGADVAQKIGTGKPSVPKGEVAVPATPSPKPDVQVSLPKPEQPKYPVPAPDAPAQNSKPAFCAALQGVSSDAIAPIWQTQCAKKTAETINSYSATFQSSFGAPGVNACKKSFCDAQ